MIINSVKGVHLRTAAIALGTAVALTACASSGTTSTSSSSAPAAVTAPIPVAANFYPVEWLVRQVGGDAVEVTDLTPVGTEPHDLALSATAREAMDSARIVYYLGSGFQPDVEKAVGDLDEDTTPVDLLTAPGVTLLAAGADLGKEPLEGNRDPHVWLDPARMAAMADDIARTLSAAAPELADDFERRRSEVSAELSSLDTQLSADLRECANRTIVTSHAAFGYLADRYGLTQIAIAGVSPDDQPDPATLEQIAADARAAGVSTVFFEEQLPRDLSETVADEIGAQVDLLSALEFDPSATGATGADYLSVMRDNGQRLSAGLSCT